MTESYEEYLANRSPRERVQEDYISRIVDSMDIKDLVQYAYDSLTDFYDEMTDEEFTEAVKEVYPDYYKENNDEAQ